MAIKCLVWYDKCRVIAVCLCSEGLGGQVGRGQVDETGCGRHCSPEVTRKVGLEGQTKEKDSRQKEPHV